MTEPDPSIDNALALLSYAECFWYKDLPEYKIVFDTRTGDVLDIPDCLIKEGKRFSVQAIKSVKEIILANDLFLVTVIQTNGDENVVQVTYSPNHNTFRIRLYDPLATIHEIINDVESAIYLRQCNHPVRDKHIKKLIPFDEITLDEKTIVNQPPDIINPDSETDDDTGFSFIEGDDDIEEPKPAPIYPRINYEDDEGMPRLPNFGMTRWFLQPAEIVVELPDSSDIPKLDMRPDNISVV